MEKIEFIKKKDAPAKFRAIINVNEDYNVGITLNKVDMRGLFYQIKHLLEERAELSEPEFSKKRQVVIEEVVTEVDKPITLEEFTDFFTKLTPRLKEKIIERTRSEESDAADSDNDIVVIVEEPEEEVVFDEVVDLPEQKIVKKKGFLGLWVTLLTAGGATTYGLLNPEIFQTLKALIGM